MRRITEFIRMFFFILGLSVAFLACAVAVKSRTTVPEVRNEVMSLVMHSDKSTMNRILWTREFEVWLFQDGNVRETVLVVYGNLARSMLRDVKQAGWDYPDFKLKILLLPEREQV
jgi:hypothetical protein